MLDNGLMEYYRSYADKKGRLQLSNFSHVQSLGRDEPFFHTYKISLYKANGKTYFGKFIPKTKMDAEILISQLYPQLGLKSATYMPAIQRTSTLVLSNNVASETCIDGSEMLFKLNEENDTNRSPFYFPKKLCSHNKYLQRFFTNGCIKQLVELHAFDVASHNIDRNLGNFFLELGDDGRADSVVTFDHETSSTITSKNPLLTDGDYISLFKSGFDDTKEGIIQSLKTNETALSVTSPKEIAEKIGNVNIDETVRDIKESIGYKINEPYVDALKRSFDDVAEDLIK